MLTRALRRQWKAWRGRRPLTAAVTSDAPRHCRLFPCCCVATATLHGTSWLYCVRRLPAGRPSAWGRSRTLAHSTLLDSLHCPVHHLSPLVSSLVLICNKQNTSTLLTYRGITHHNHYVKELQKREKKILYCLAFNFFELWWIWHHSKECLYVGLIFMIINQWTINVTTGMHGTFNHLKWIHHYVWKVSIYF